jgi:hypothetical protein
MDKYVSSTFIPDFNLILGRTELARNIWNCIQDSKGCTMCIYGPPGCGKTYIIKKLLGNLFVETDTPLVSSSTTPVVIKNPTGDIIEFLKTNGSYCSGTTIIICENIKKIDFCNCFEVPYLTEDEINKWFSGYPDAARMCEGNMWNFEFYKQFKDPKDKFWTPKDYVYRIMTTKQESYIKSSVDEHGHTFGMIHENYNDTRGITIDECVDIIDSISLADMYDTLIYKQDWEYCKFFQIEGIARPATIINGRFNHSSLRPGSCWTKMNNQKMRASKLKRFKPVYHKKLILILDNLMKSGPSKNFYEFTPADVDVVNHLNIINKFKPSEILRLKKSLSSYHATSLQEQNIPTE